ncbi:hypothetical protein Lesp02_62080 [Lentzea sp. NBRC 105346]|nr:hypothetical protein Lesp02_62080 [Lentzea sp. NBRC 105346]
MFAAGTVISTPASAGEVGTTDFFPCPYTPYIAQERSDMGRWLVLEYCWSTDRGDWMYRANIRSGVQNYDELRTAYYPYSNGKYVDHSYRQAPQDVKDGQMPNEWVLSGNGGRDLQACLTSGITGTLYCTWP